MTISEWLTFFVGITTLVVAYLSYRNSSDTRDISSAISQLSTLAVQTKRQADVQSGQLALLKEQRKAVFRQADAAADAAAAAKESASLAKAQTGAIVRQANALIKSAAASVSASSAQLESARANTVTASEGIKAAQAAALAAEKQQAAAEVFAAERIPVEKLSAVQLEGWIGTDTHIALLKIKIKPTFTNIGGGTLLPDITTLNLAITGTEVPRTLTPSLTTSFGRNVYPVPVGQSYWPEGGIQYELSTQDYEDLNAHRKLIVVWGQSEFRDNAGTKYKYCYLAVVTPPAPDILGSVITLEGDSTYRCSSM